MPHPALVERHVPALFDDPSLMFDDIYAFDLAPFTIIDQHFIRAPERPAVFYDEIIARNDFDSLLIPFDSMLVAFDDVHRRQQNFSSREHDGRRRRPSVVVLS